MGEGSVFRSGRDTEALSVVAGANFENSPERSAGIF